MLQNSSRFWGETTVVYGPIWTLICKIATALSFGNTTICLLIFKILSLGIHLLSCYLIYRITKKVIFVLMYGLSPFVLLEAIANVHNDLWVVCLVLASIYFLLRKRKLVLSILLLAIATTIKYFTILLLPFIIIYYYRKEHPIVRLKKCILYGMFFVVCVVCIYLLTIQNLTILQGIIAQQEKYTKSIGLVVYLFTNNFAIVDTMMKTLLGAFTIYYAIICINWLTTKNITWQKMMRSYGLILCIFLFVLITNFQPWYILWLFSGFMWQKAVTLRNVLWVGLTSQFANSFFMMYGEGYQNGVVFVLIMIISMAIIGLLQKAYKLQKMKKLEEKN